MRSSLLARALAHTSQEARVQGPKSRGWGTVRGAR